MQQQQPSARPEGSVYQLISSLITQRTIGVPSHPPLCPMHALKDKRLDPATAKARPVRQPEKDQPPSEPGDARALPPPPWLTKPARPAPRRETGPPAGSASLLQLPLSLFRPRPCHQPWACGCAPWWARVCKVLGRRGLTHLRASAARREGTRGGGFAPGSGRATGLGSASRCGGARARPACGPGAPARP